MAEEPTPPATDEKEADKSGLFLKLQGWYREDIPGVTKWRMEAKEAWDFYNGDQWGDSDKQALKAKRRPELTFNRVAPLVNAVVGSEINNRREVRYIPREQGDAQANEVLTAAGEWFRDECGAEDEESDAFKATVITGMGWTDTRLDYETDPNGSPEIRDVDAMEMVWDCTSVKPNLSDAQRMFRVREMDWNDAEALTGESDPAKLHAGWVKNATDDSGKPHNQDLARWYQGGQNEFVNGQKPKKCLIVEVRWLEREVFYRGPDLENAGQVREYSEQLFSRLNDRMREQRGVDFPGVRQVRKVLRRAFLGSEVLGETEPPMVPPGTGLFGWECITGYRDKNKGLWYGIVRVAKDPQRWANKFFSQVMFLLNSQSKGGIIAENSAFENQSQAEKSWAAADEITWAKDGTLSGNSPKWMQKPVAQFPAGFFTLFQESKEAISQVTGLSQEFIGTREVDQANVLETTRRQASLNLLAELFNSLRRYRKRQGRTMLYIIQSGLADGRLIRIVGDGLSRYVPLTRADVADVEYDIIVDDSPSSPNEKERTWAIIQSMMPFVQEMLTPEMVVELLPYSPLPASFVDKMREKLGEMQQAQAQQPSPEEIKAQADQASAQIAIQGKQADIQAKQASAQIDQQSKVADLFFKGQQQQMDMAVAQQKSRLELLSIAVKERQNELAAKRANNQRISAPR